MPRLIWSPPALLDIQRIFRFLATKNIDAAHRALKAIRDGVRLLALHPEIGRPAADMDPEFREWPIDFGDSGYVVRYRYDDGLAVILALRHQREVDYPRDST